MSTAPGTIVVLNGAPRAGKSSIVAVIQDTFDGPWLNLGVDVARSMTPELIMERRNASPPGRYALATPGAPVPPPVQRWQDTVHVPGIYDLEVDTSAASPEECAAAIRRRLEDGAPFTAFATLAAAMDG